MDDALRTMALRYRPVLYKDKREPFPVRFIGCTVFTEKRRSESFPKWVVDPAAAGAQAIIEYAIFYDYDIQHLYDLEHIWAAVDGDGNLTDCWSSFHGMRLRAAGHPSFRTEEGRPVLYSQPGKHAMLPDPALFELLPDLRAACGELAGGGLLIPGFLSGAVRTDEDLDDRIRRHIKTSYAFTPSMEFVREELADDIFVSWPELLRRIPKLLEAQIEQILS